MISILNDRLRGSAFASRVGVDHRRAVPAALRALERDANNIRGIGREMIYAVQPVRDPLPECLLVRALGRTALVLEPGALSRVVGRSLLRGELLRAGGHRGGGHREHGQREHDHPAHK